MMNLEPILITLTIAAAVTSTGIMIAMFRNRRLFSGFADLQFTAKSIANKLNGDILRESGDLVIRGNYHGLPTTVRFSDTKRKPRLSIRMNAQCTFTLSVASRSAKNLSGGVSVQTPDKDFDGSFSSRTDTPMEAMLFLSDGEAMTQLRKMCSSSRIFFRMNAGSLVFHETAITASDPAKQIEDYLDSMAAIGAITAEMPGAYKIRITVPTQQKHLLTRLAIAMLVVAGAMEISSAVRNHPAQIDVVEAASKPSMPAIPDAESRHLTALKGWRLAHEDDFDSGNLAWLRQVHGGDITGRILAKFGGPDQPASTAYAFVRDSGSAKKEWRITFMVNSIPVLDGIVPDVMVVAVVPQDSFSGIEWLDSGSRVVLPPDGDGLLVVRQTGETQTGTIYYLSGGKVQAATPSSYLNVRVQ